MEKFSLEQPSARETKNWIFSGSDVMYSTQYAPYQSYATSHLICLNFTLQQSTKGIGVLFKSRNVMWVVNYT